MGSGHAVERAALDRQRSERGEPLNRRLARLSCRGNPPQAFSPRDRIQGPQPACLAGHRTHDRRSRHPDRPLGRPVAHQSLWFRSVPGLCPGQNRIPNGTPRRRANLGRHAMRKHRQPWHNNHARKQQAGSDLHRQPCAERERGRLAALRCHDNAGSGPGGLSPLPPPTPPPQPAGGSETMTRRSPGDWPSVSGSRWGIPGSKLTAVRRRPARTRSRTSSETTSC